MTRILVADKLHPSTLSQLQALPRVEVMDRPGVGSDALPQEVGTAEVLVVRSTKVTDTTLQAGSSLGLVIRAGAGVNTIDVTAASHRGIYVANCPGQNAVAVAELAMGHLLAADRRIPDNAYELRQGRWNKKAFSTARGLKGCTLGVVGTGAIGGEVIARALSFGMHVLAWSRSLSADRARFLGVEPVAALDELAGRSDAVSVHLALAPETRGLLGASFFAALRPGTIFINTSRAEVVDAQAMRGALAEGRIFAGLDVFDDEPAVGEGAFDNPLKQLPNWYGTHHIGASTDQAERATGAEVVRIVKCFVEGAEIPNCVNLRPTQTSPGGLVIRHADKVGVLAGVLSVLKEKGYNVQDMTNQIFAGPDAAACARIMTSPGPTRDVVNHIEKQCEGVLHVTLIEPGP